MKKAFQIQTVQLFIGLACLLLVIGFFGDKVHASTPKFQSISCQTMYGEKQFTIQGNTVSFHHRSNGRYLSSVSNSIAQNTQKGLKKTLYINNRKHLINIKNINKMSDAEDFMTITSTKGHKITYPLNCKLES